MERGLARWLVRRAVLRLPKDRDRWREEWNGDLDRLPGPLSRLGWALAIYVRAAPEQAELLRGKADERSAPAGRLPWLRRRGDGSFRVAAALAALAVIVFVT